MASNRQGFVRRSGKTAGHLFTLIELLVVIAIISVLAALLLPALQSSLDSARSVSCTGNLKQQGMMVSNYANTYSDYIPPFYNVAGTAHFLSISNGGPYGNFGSFITFLQGYYYGKQISEWGAGGSVESALFLCPADNAAGRKPGKTQDRRWAGYQGAMQVWQYLNGRQTKWTPSWTGYEGVLRPASEIRRPSLTPLIGDSCTGGDTDFRVVPFVGTPISEPFNYNSGNVNLQNGAGGMRLSHAGNLGCNVLYFDNHIAAIRFPNIPPSLYSSWLSKN